jgi:hypothetical protein
MKATYLDSIQMDALLLYAHRILAEAEQLATGRQVRITFYGEADTVAMVVPARVATYARRAMGQPVPLREVGRVVFFSQGVAVAWLPSTAGWAALLLAVIAHQTAQRRRLVRAMAKLKRAQVNLRTTTNGSAGEGKEVQP